MRTTLAAVSDHRDALSFQGSRICVFFPEHLGHVFFSLEIEIFYPALVTAPSDADETSFAYLAITPVV